MKLCFLEMTHNKEINFNFLNSKNSIKTRIVSVHTLTMCQCETGEERARGSLVDIKDLL